MKKPFRSDALPTKVVPREAVERALSCALSSGQRAYITDEAIENLWLSCIAMQDNCIANPLLSAFFSTARALWKALDTSQELAESMTLLHIAITDRRLGEDDDIGITEYLEDSITQDYIDFQNQRHVELRELRNALKAMKSSEFLEVRRLDAKQNMWRGFARWLAADFLKAAATAVPKPGRIDPPAKFLVAIIPYITGEIEGAKGRGNFTFGAVRQHLATKEPSQPRAKRDDFPPIQKKSVTRRKSQKTLTKQRQ